MRTKKMSTSGISAVLSFVLLGALIFSSCAKKEQNLPAPSSEAGNNNAGLKNAKITGFTWTKQLLAPSGNWYATSFINATNGYITGGGGAMVKTINGINYTSVSTGTTNDLYACHFLTTSTGFIAGNAATFKLTTNGGSSWTSPSLPTLPSGTFFWGISFISGSVGYLTGGSPSGPVVLKTTNGGTSWSLVTGFGAGATAIYAVAFTDANNGFASGNYGYLYKTTDGGTTWTATTVGTATDVCTGMHFTSTTVGYVTASNYLGTDSTRIFKTTNGGSTWNVIELPVSSMTAASVKFFDANTGYVVGGSISANTGYICRTNNAGASWTVEAIPACGRLMQMSLTTAASNERLFAVGLNSTIIKGE